MEKHNRKLSPIVVSLSFLILVSFPYFLAYKVGGEGLNFGGFLLNPLDGNSYLAKMYQGKAGSWQFKLPFTTEPGQGAYLFMFYLALGHLARIINLPNILIFHLVRLLSSALLLWSLWLFWGEIFKDHRTRKLAFVLSVLGSGSGWLVMASGSLTSDFWVAEGYPFLSAYVNPHFTLGMALVLWLIHPKSNKQTSWREVTACSIVALLLSVVNPFGVVIAIMVLGGELFWALLQRFQVRAAVGRILPVLIMGLPMLVYDFWVANHHPLLRIWNSQNITPSPAVGDLIISLSPAILAGCWGIVSWAKSAAPGKHSTVTTLVIWLMLGLIAIYLPFGLQRRFMMGIFVPVAGLAAYGLESLAGLKKFPYRSGSFLLVLLSLPTNLVVIMIAISGILNRDTRIYLSGEEIQTMGWISTHTSPQDVILASPEMGLFIPAYTGRRVLYGHPFETIHATEQEKAVLDFFQASDWNEQQDIWLREQEVDYLFYGKREKALGELTIPTACQLVYQIGDVSLYRVGSGIP